MFEFSYSYDGEISFDLDPRYLCFLEARIQQYSLSSYIRLNLSSAFFFKNKPNWQNHYLIFCDFLLFIEKYGTVRKCSITFGDDNIRYEPIILNNGLLYDLVRNSELSHTFQKIRETVQRQFTYLTDYPVNLEETRKSIVGPVHTPLFEAFMRQSVDLTTHRYQPDEINVLLPDGSSVPSCDSCIHRLKNLYEDGCFFCLPKKTK